MIYLEPVWMHFVIRSWNRQKYLVYERDKDTCGVKFPKEVITPSDYIVSLAVGCGGCGEKILSGRGKQEINVIKRHIPCCDNCGAVHFFGYYWRNHIFPVSKCTQDFRIGLGDKVPELFRYEL